MNFHQAVSVVVIRERRSLSLKASLPTKVMLLTLVSTPSVIS